MYEKKNYNTIVMWILGAAIVVIIALQPVLGKGSNSTSTSSQPKLEVKSQIAKPAPLDGYCPGLNSGADETWRVLAGAGTTSSVQEILDVLKRNADLYAGYASLVSEPNASSVISDASTEMLEIRAGLLDGTDITRTAMFLKSDFQTIQQVCAY